MAVVVELVCPACGGDLDVRSESIRCVDCLRSYPVVVGIPDLRLFPDRYLSLADDRAKAERLDAVPGSALDVIDAYWSMTPEVPPSLAAAYRSSASRTVERGAAVIDRLSPATIGASLLDVGCGTGGLVVAAALRGYDATGIDIALRWLVVCRRLAADHDVDVRFAAADGAAAPFPPRSFDTVTCVESIEHSADRRGLLHGSMALADREYHAVVANRFSTVTDPTFGLALVGYLPRSWAAAYVRARRGTSASFYVPPSLSELGSWLGPDDSRPARRAQISSSRLPSVDADDPRIRRYAVALHDHMVGSRIEPLIRPVAPMLAVRWRS